jgi:hypothetical protein
MAKHPRRRRDITWTVGNLSAAPFGEPESDSVRWMCVDGSDVTPDPYSDLRLRFEMRAGTWVCTGLFLLAGHLTAHELSERFPFAQLEESAVEGLSLLTRSEPPRVTAPRRRGRLGNSDEFLGQVAELYRFATKHPEFRHAPVAYIREQKDLWRQGHQPHEDTVRGWVRQARRRGLLGASIPGKAGEQDVGSETDASYDEGSR